MADSSTVEIDGIGPVLFERSLRAKHLNISVKPFKGVRVAIPDGLSFEKAEELAHSKVGWIQKQQEKMRQFESEQDANSSAATDIDRAKAKRKLKQRLRHLADKHGFNYNRVFIRNQRTRWGSCSPKNNISLNMMLVRLPDDLRDYVLLHELVHTRIRKHDNRFWSQLEGLVSNAKIKDSRLKEYGAALL